LKPPRSNPRRGRSGNHHGKKGAKGTKWLQELALRVHDGCRDGTVLSVDRARGRRDIEKSK